MHTSILPQPRSVASCGGFWQFSHKSHFSTGHALVISADPGLERQAGLLANYLREENHMTVTVAAGGAGREHPLGARARGPNPRSGIGGGGISG